MTTFDIHSEKTRHRVIFICYYSTVAQAAEKIIASAVVFDTKFRSTTSVVAGAAILSMEQRGRPAVGTETKLRLLLRQSGTLTSKKTNVAIAFHDFKSYVKVNVKLKIRL